MKTFVKFTNYFLAVCLIVIAGLLAYVAVPAFGNKALIVRSGSMEPTIKTGDLIVVKIAKGVISPVPNAVSKYQEGDVIAFKGDKDPNVLTTHRIVSKKIENGKSVYQTQGDANQSPDSQFVKEEQIVGRSGLTIPKAGKIFAFAKTKNGFALLVLIPALLVIALESSTLIKEIIKVARARRMLLSDPISVVEKNKLFGPVGLRMLMPFVLGLMFFHNSYAYFSDSAASLNNTFVAAASFPSPSPSPTNVANHLVINEVMFDPPNENACGNEGDAEWVEIYNPTTSAVNLDTWLIGDTLFTDDLPSVLLLPGGFAIASNCTQSSFNAIWSLPIGTIYIDLSSVVGNGLNNGGEHMRLLDGVTMIDDMSYGSNADAFSPPVTAAITDHSLERNPDGLDTNTAADFFDRIAPTPGI